MITRHAPQRRGGVAALACAAALLAACGQPPSSYFPTLSGVEDTSGGAAPTGARVLIGVADLVAQPGDDVILESLDVPGTGSAHVQSYLLHRSDTGGGGIGFLVGDDFAGYSFDRLARSLPGYSLSTADGEVQVVVGLQSSSPGVIHFSDVVLHFRVNGNEAEETFANGGTVCFVTDPGATCPPSS